jgi:hypothetical protein
VKNKHAQVFGKKKSFFEAEAHVSSRQISKKQELLKRQLLEAQLKLTTEKDKNGGTNSVT